jgi:hypothetical protein
MRARLRCLAAAAILLSSLATPNLFAAKPPRVHALVGARIVVAPGKVIEHGTIVIRDGTIVAVGKDVATPADARVWDGKGLTVYAGLIEPYSARSWPAGGKEGDKAPQGSLSNGTLHPERDMTLYAVDESAAKKLREAGFTAALVAPKDGLLRGQSVVVELGSGDVNANLLRQSFAQHAGLKPVGRRSEEQYPVSLMGTVALFRQTMYDADWYGKAHAAYTKNPAQERPMVEPGLAALDEVVHGKQTIIFESDDMLDTLRIAHLVNEFNLKAIVVGSGDEYKRLDAIKATHLATILTVNFPKAPKIDGQGDETTDLEDLRAWDAAPDNPAKMLSTGVDVAFTTYKLDDPKKIYENLAKSMTRGLTADQALTAMTVTPAKMLGLSGRLGTIEVGKIANLTVVDGNLFVEKPKIREVWVDGDRFEVRESKPAETNPVGVWQLNIKAGEQEIPVVLELTGKVESLSGSISAMGQKTTIISADVSGNKVEIAYDGGGFGMPGSFTLSLEINGDNATGTGTSPRGPYTVTGSRSSAPPSHNSQEVAP